MKRETCNVVWLVIEDPFGGTMKGLLVARGAPHEVGQWLQSRIRKTGNVPRVLASHRFFKFMEALVLCYSFASGSS